MLGEEETYWKQRAKSFWLSDGDANTRYFHNFASNRKRKNRIERLRDEQGNWQNSKVEVDGIIKRYYSDLFSDSNTEIIDFPEFEPRISDMDNDCLLSPITDFEVRKAIFSMHNDKSPGPDGFNPAFFKTYWNMIGSDVVNMCKEFFAVGSFKKGLNNTALVLIPKVTNPETISDLRPIALCNVAYKIISNVMANRMKGLMPKIISENQSAFVENRLITDNFLIAFEIGHYLRCKRRGKFGMAALKIDMSKAYDRVRWDFVELMLRRLGFCDKWVNLLMFCVSSVQYTSIGDNEYADPIVPMRGLRQGDPMSPYLFIICAEGLSLLLDRAESEDEIHGVMICRGAPSINHLFFADDYFLFFRALVDEMTVVKRILDLYEKVASQKVNFTKSNVMYSANVKNEDRIAFKLVLDVEEASSSSKYLGLPSLVGRDKYHIFGYIKEKVWNKVKGWNSKFLSRGGKEILIKTVAQSMPNYVMNVFLIPLRLCEELERMLNSFWWGRDQVKKKGINWARWDKLCIPKKFGGKGFKKIREFNLAMLARQAWRFISVENNLMVKVFKAKYFPKTTFLEANLGANPNYVRRSIFETIPVMKKGARVKIGNGKMTKVWGNPWTNGISGLVETAMPENLSSTTVDSLFVVGGNVWDDDLLKDVFSASYVENIRSIPLSNRDIQDGWRWKFEPKGNFSVKSYYRAACGDLTSHPSDLGNNLWKVSAPLHIRNFLWRTCSGYLPTSVALADKRIFINDRCLVCSDGMDSPEHLLFSCTVAVDCWKVVSVPPFPVDGCFSDWVGCWLTSLKEEERSLVAYICWLLWQNRNSAVWRKKVGSASDILSSARAQLAAWKDSQSTQFKRIGLLKKDGQIRWSSPPQGWYKVNVDAALFSGQEGIMIGIVFRDWQGSLVQARLLKVRGSFLPRTAELMGCEKY